MSPGCCKDGWKITLAGSRFLKPTKALAMTWALEQTHCFSQGCNNLLVITGHKPLVKLFGDRSLDEISNPHLFHLKLRMLMWRFNIEHQPGKDNYLSDATSCHPTFHYRGDSSVLCCICITKEEGEDMETDLMRIQRLF